MLVGAFLVFTEEHNIFLRDTSYKKDNINNDVNVI